MMANKPPNNVPTSNATSASNFIATITMTTSGTINNQGETLNFYGGSLSVRRDKSSKPLIIFGQDEAIFKQFLFRKRQWVGPDGQRPLIPKDEGQGVMISAFQSREFGFGFRALTDEELKRVNASRKGKHYSDQEAAVMVGHKEGLKPPLDNHQFYIEFEYGSGKEGYWSYEWMVTQLEDCVDVLKVLHPEFDLVFYLIIHVAMIDKERMD